MKKILILTVVVVLLISVVAAKKGVPGRKLGAGTRHHLIK